MAAGVLEKTRLLSSCCCCWRMCAAAGFLEKDEAVAVLEEEEERMPLSVTKTSMREAVALKSPGGCKGAAVGARCRWNRRAVVEVRLALSITSEYCGGLYVGEVGVEDVVLCISHTPHDDKT